METLDFTAIVRADAPCRLLHQSRNPGCL